MRRERSKLPLEVCLMLNAKLKQKNKVDQPKVGYGKPESQEQFLEQAILSNAKHILSDG